jgi:hypothetical protein
MKIKSILQPQGSVISGVAVAGSVFAIYSLECGTIGEAHFSDANHGSLQSCRKKAAYTAFAFVSAVTLLTRDANVGVLGFGTMIAMDLQYRHAIMVDPSTGVMQAPAESEASSYTPAQNVVPIGAQGAPFDASAAAGGY